MMFNPPLRGKSDPHLGFLSRGFAARIFAIFLVLERESWNDHFSLAKRFMLKVIGPISVLLSSFAMLSAAVAAEKEVELLTDAEFLQPTSTFEFRFATPVVFREEVGTVAANPPILIQPALAGTFTWLSQRSGVFVPTAPPPLGVQLAATIRPDFRDFNGNPVGQSFRAVLQTPAYAITAVNAPEEQ